MKIDAKRVGAYAVSFLLTLSLALAVNAVVSSATVTRPLAQAYSQLGFVRNFQLRNSASGVQVVVSAMPVDDLQVAYGQLHACTAQVLGHDRFTLTIEDQRDEYLKRVYDGISLYVHEAIATGRFAEMISEAQAKCSEAQVDARIVVDLQRVYVSLKRGNSYLYEIVPRGAVQP